MIRLRREPSREGSPPRLFLGLTANSVFFCNKFDMQEGTSGVAYLLPYLNVLECGA